MVQTLESLGDLLGEIVTSDIPGPRSRELAQRLSRCEAPASSAVVGDTTPPVFWEQARGANVVDADGNRYVDLTAGFCVAVAGHANPAITAAIADQAARLLHTQGIANPSPPRVALAERLAEVAPPGLTNSYVVTTGAEVAENAIKIARAATGKHTIIAFQGGFHGKLGAALGASSQNGYREPFVSALPGIVHAPFPDTYRSPFGDDVRDVGGACARYLERLLEFPDSGVSNVAAIIMEPVQGHGGWIVPSSEFVQRVRRLCDRHGIVFIADEIITGFGRTGKWFGMQIHGVVPDLMVCGKGMASGFPVAAVLGKPEILSKLKPRQLGATFMGNPVAAAACLASIGEIEKRGLVDRARDEGAYYLAQLEGLRSRHPLIGDVRGVGMMTAIELVKDRTSRQPAPTEARQLVGELLRRGVMATNLGGSYGNVLKMSPPLVITRGQLDFALEQLDAALTAVEARL